MAFLKVRDSDGFHDVAILEDGRSLTVGRGEECAVTFPNDYLMSTRHLSLYQNAGRCQIEDLGSTNGTFLNGERVDHAEVFTGDVIRCGCTELSVEFGNSDYADLSSARQIVAVGQKNKQPPPEELLAVQGFLCAAAGNIVRRFHLRQSIPLTPEEQEPAVDFIQRLPTAAAKLEFLAYALPRRAAIWWLIRAASDLPEISLEERELLQSAHAWIAEPDDLKRREIWQLAAEQDPGRIFHWIGMAVFFSSGSVAPPQAPLVPPGDNVCGKAVLAGMTMLALGVPPADSEPLRKQLADAGLEIADRGIPQEVIST